MGFKEEVRINYIFNTLCQIINILIPIITLPYLSRVLQAEGLGRYSFVYSIAYYFFLFFMLGVDNYGSRTIAAVRDNNDKISSTFWEIFAIQLFLGIVFSLLYVFCCVFVFRDNYLFWIFLILVVTGGIDFTWFLYGPEDFKVTSIRDIFIKLITTIAIFIFVTSRNDVWKYALIYNLV